MPDHRPGRLNGMTCLIVGGTSGIGLASARRFLVEGARLVVSGRDDDHLARAGAELAGPGLAGVLVADLADPAAIAGLVPEAARRLGGRLDILFHVAGISGRRLGDGPLEDCTDEGWDAVLSANARAPFVTNRAAVRQMLGQARDRSGLRGTVLNLGSVLARSPSPGLFHTAAYAASKGAILSMTLTAAAAYAPEGIRFNVLAPGLTATPMSARALGDPAILRYLQTKQPLAPGPAPPDDLAEAALYLSEPASRLVTGAVLTVDGGWTVSEGRHDGTESKDIYPQMTQMYADEDKSN